MNKSFKTKTIKNNMYLLKESRQPQKVSMDCMDYLSKGTEKTYRENVVESRMKTKGKV